MSNTQINSIVQILLNEEFNLSDGYHFYCMKKTEIKLKEIAMMILDSLNKEEKEPIKDPKLEKIGKILESLCNKKEEQDDCKDCCCLKNK